MLSYIKPLKIGHYQTRHNLILAPLAGITDFAFREIARGFGADLTFTEMVSVDGLYYSSRKTRELMDIGPDEPGVGVQLFGARPELYREVLPMVLEMHPRVIDLNFGCPVPKVVKKGAGSAVLKNLDLLQKIVESCVNESVPVTAKIRIGWDPGSIVAVEAALAAEAGGAKMVTVHGRTRSQGYAGKADWEPIARVKSAVNIPVVGNGDVFSPESARRMFEETRVDGIMLARGVLGRPWLFREILEALNGREASPEMSFENRLAVLKRHYALAVQQLGDTLALTRMKKHFVWYTHGLPHAARLRNEIFRVRNYADVEKLLENYARQLTESERKDA